jgi:hypothetical protein
VITVVVKFAPRFIAAVVLLGWLFAIGHRAAVHGASAFSSVDHELFGHDEDDHEDEHPEHHHHDLSVLPAAPLTKATDQDSLAPAWTSLYDEPTANLALVQPDSARSHGDSCFGNAPPDRRASGWLLVCRTALPVRGPSLLL